MVSGEFEVGGAFSAGGIDDPSAVGEGEVDVFLIGTPVRAIVRDVHAAKVWDFFRPQDLSIIGIECDHAVEALQKGPTVHSEG